ncbi:MAG: VanW family protein [Nannocystis sp.]|uniref:VanW family protein n=1 Tax=Nannocystis sp. TaxID=1962667 RepID=UPI0024232299|nr:VanW family protein [Nannocystis sp.]MBK9757870.1 VanW family protein [Nannocystis sp.]
MSALDDREATPTRLGAIVHAAKVRVHQLARTLRDLGSELHPASPGDALRGGPLLAESRSRLWTAEDPREWPLEQGKVENLRIAARKLDGLELPAGATFSFWAQIGRPTRSQGFVAGREIREGCIVPAIAGGICQLSNALYEVALRAGLEIRERHPHSRTVPGSQAALGRDATVLWNYIDLRFRSDRPLRLEVLLDAEQLVVRLRGPAPRHRHLPVLQDSIAAPKLEHDCHTCGETVCFRHDDPGVAPAGRSAYLVDELWPEFDRHLARVRRRGDLLLLPLDGRMLGRPRYAWSSAGFTALQHPRAALLRAFHSRRLAAQGAARQRALLADDDRLALAMARSLPLDVRHLVVAQNLLPALWRHGTLGGRRFEVLLTRLPLADLHARLDRAAAVLKDSPTLADFRAEAWRVDAEQAALAAADRVITPHAGLAARFPGRCERLAWELPRITPEPADRPSHVHPPIAREPADRPSSPRPLIAFPASTVGRKGAWELRAALRALDREVTVWVAGRPLEGPEFWRGLDVREGGECPGRPDLVVLPAHIEHQPRALLTALARGVPVIASDACGLDPRPGLVIVPAGDVAALRAAIAAALP